MPQDPLSRAVVREDPFAKATGISRWQAKHGAQWNPLEAKINKADPVQKAFASTPAARAGNLVIIDRQTQ